MRIDLNADLGEERGDDAALFACISSANIACGAHAGSRQAMDVALRSAAIHGVTIGAHVGYADRANFGRVPMEVDRPTLTGQIVQQIGQLQEQAARFGLLVRYVKPHGALYHAIGTDTEHAHALVDAVTQCDASLELLVPLAPTLQDIAQDLQCRHEFFADRGYLLSGQLVGRQDTRAHIDDVGRIVARTLEWLRTGEVRSVEGKNVRIFADSICLHGDSPFAVQTAQHLRSELQHAGYRIVNWLAP